MSESTPATPSSDPGAGEPGHEVEHKVMSAAAKLFDLRFMIDGLFGVYGVLLTIYSSFDSQAAIDKASGIHINLWLGLSMIVVAPIFGAWAKLQPASRRTLARRTIAARRVITDPTPVVSPSWGRVPDFVHPATRQRPH